MTLCHRFIQAMSIDIRSVLAVQTDLETKNLGKIADYLLLYFNKQCLSLIQQIQLGKEKDGCSRHYKYHRTTSRPKAQNPTPPQENSTFPNSLELEPQRQVHFNFYKQDTCFRGWQKSFLLISFS